MSKILTIDEHEKLAKAISDTETALQNLLALSDCYPKHFSKAIEKSLEHQSGDSIYDLRGHLSLLLCLEHSTMQDALKIYYPNDKIY